MTTLYNMIRVTGVALYAAASIAFIVPTTVYAQETEQPVEEVLESQAENSEEANEENSEDNTAEQVAVTEVLFKANAGTDKNVAVGRTVLFDASATTAPEGAVVQYEWDFGDGTIAEGIDATHIYSESGVYRATLTARIEKDGLQEASTAEIIVSVEDRLVLLITDQSVKQTQIEELQEYALTQGALVIPIRDSGVDQEFQTLTNLATQLLEHKDDIAASNMIITWTNGGVGLNSLLELSRVADLNSVTLDQFAFGSKAIVSVSNNQSLSSSKKNAASVFQSVKPSYIVVANENILDDAVRAQSIDEFQRRLSITDAEYQIITEYSVRAVEKLTPFNFMSYAVHYMINRGVPVNSLFLILMLPVMATIIAAARQLIGVKAFGIFAPTVIALSFLATGLKYGITIFIAIIVMGGIARSIARRFRLLYLPRMGLVMTLLALAVFAMFFVGAWANKTGFVAVSIFPILIMAVLAEHFVSVQIQQGYKAALKLTIETLSLSILGYLIGDWTLFKTTILAYPELILLTVVFNYAMGKYSGLRLMEYLRFRKVFRHMSDAEKQ